MNRCSISLIIREIQINTTRYHLTPVRMAIIKKDKWQVLLKIWRKGNLHALPVEWSSAATMEKNMEVPQKNKKQNYHMTWRRQWQPTPVVLPGKSHGQAGYSPWGRKSQIRLSNYIISVWQFHYQWFHFIWRKKKKTLMWKDMKRFEFEKIWTLLCS